jgi:hypothetical protein
MPEVDPLLKSTLTPRTPVKTSSTMSNNMETDAHNGGASTPLSNKRKAEGKSMDDLCELIQDLKRQNTLIRGDISKSKMEVIDKICKVEDELKVTNDRMGKVEKTANEGLLLAQENRKYLENRFKQEKLQNVMEISGINNAKYVAQTNATKLALETFESLTIPVAESDIAKAIVRENNYKKADGTEVNNKILVVTFVDFDKKVSVMQKKMKMLQNGGVFFNMALTSTNAYLMRKARTIAKTKNLKVHFGDGVVRVKQRDGRDMLICGNKELEELQRYVDTLAIATQGTSA